MSELGKCSSIISSGSSGSSGSGGSGSPSSRCKSARVSGISSTSCACTLTIGSNTKIEAHLPQLHNPESAWPTVHLMIARLHLEVNCTNDRE